MNPELEALAKNAFQKMDTLDLSSVELNEQIQYAPRTVKEPHVPAKPPKSFLEESRSSFNKSIEWIFQNVTRKWNPNLSNQLISFIRS